MLVVPHDAEKAVMETALTDDIYDPRHYQGVYLPLWVLYDHPSDFPNHYVLRLFDLDRPTPITFIAETMDEMTAQMDTVPHRFFRLERDPFDDPNIVAVFV